jgi:flagellar basal body rod protein FlgG
MCVPACAVIRSRILTNRARAGNPLPARGKERLSIAARSRARPAQAVLGRTGRLAPALLRWGRMDNGLYLGVAAMRTTEKRLDTIASNLANLSAHGYKRQAPVTRAFTVGTGERKHVEIATQTATDWTQGQVERTENQLDFALDGHGFFAVETPTGRAYTRDGRFHLDSDGNLLTADGFRVAWEGAPARVQPAGEPIVVDASGAVRQGGASIGRLRLVDFADAQRLEEDARGNWRAPRGLSEKPTNAALRQGAVERSNVDAMDELVAMVVAQRRFENSTSVMRSIEQTYRRLNQPR